MKIGILSDTHDNLPKIKKAVSFFNKNKVGFVLHAGDFVAPFAVLKLKELLSDWRGVFGNNDGERTGLSGISEGRIQEGPLKIELQNRKIILAHDINKVNPKPEEADLIICGHTHKAEILRQGTLLIVNPGECGGWLTQKSTVILLDLDSLSSQIFEV